MAGKLESKIALVTGAGRGIGRTICVALANEGATVILVSKTIEKLNETAELVEKAGGKSFIVVTDFMQDESIANLVKIIKDKFGKLDILINNAGVTQTSSFEETSSEIWRKCMQINATAPFILCRDFLPLLKNDTVSYIINISSVVGVKGYPLQVAYTASKHAMRGMTMVLGEELNNTNIRVHLICPGGVDTDLIPQVRPDLKKEDLMRREEISDLVMYLVTHEGIGFIDELHIRRTTSKPWF